MEYVLRGMSIRMVPYKHIWALLKPYYSHYVPIVKTSNSNSCQSHHKVVFLIMLKHKLNKESHTDFDCFDGLRNLKALL